MRPSLRGPKPDLGENIRVTISLDRKDDDCQPLRGEHPLKFLNSTLGWRYTFAIAARDEPDRKVRFDMTTNLVFSNGIYLIVPKVIDEL